MKHFLFFLFFQLPYSGENCIIVTLGANELLGAKRAQQVEPVIARASMILCQQEIDQAGNVEAFRLARKHRGTREWILWYLDWWERDDSGRILFVQMLLWQSLGFTAHNLLKIKKIYLLCVPWYLSFSFKCAHSSIRHLAMPAWIGAFCRCATSFVPMRMRWSEEGACHHIY